MKLYFSRNPNPRLAVAVARYLNAKVEFEFASPFAPGQAERFRPLNPNLSLPILVGSGKSLWEADAIACRLSRDARSDLWRTGDDEPEMIRWLSWGKQNFARACDVVHFERGTKQRFGLGRIDQHRVEEGLRDFRTAAATLEAELSEREWLVENSVPMPTFEWRRFCPLTMSPDCRSTIILLSAAGIVSLKESTPGAILSKDWARLNCRRSRVRPDPHKSRPE